MHYERILLCCQALSHVCPVPGMCWVLLTALSMIDSLLLMLSLQVVLSLFLLLIMVMMTIANDADDDDDDDDNDDGEEDRRLKLIVIVVAAFCSHGDFRWFKKIYIIILHNHIYGCGCNSLNSLIETKEPLLLKLISTLITLLLYLVVL